MDALRVVEYLSSTLVTVIFANLAIYGAPPCGIWMAKHGLKAKHRWNTKPLSCPICSMYGICTKICPKNHPNVVKYTIHGASGCLVESPCWMLRHASPITFWIVKPWLVHPRFNKDIVDLIKICKGASLSDCPPLRFSWYPPSHRPCHGLGFGRHFFPLKIDVF